MSAALAGIRVVDLTNNQAGPSCGQMLAWLGADVIKVEEPGQGDPARHVVGDPPDIDSLFFLSFNANKRSLPLNLKSRRARRSSAPAPHRRRAPGELRARRHRAPGVRVSELKAINPRLVAATIKGFGSYGPYATTRATSRSPRPWAGR